MSDTPHLTTRHLTVAQALVAFLARQYTERDGRRARLIAATWGIFGHGNVAGIGQALLESGPEAMPFLQGRNEQAMVHAAVGYARRSGRLSAHAVTTSIGPGATNLVTGAALATINRIPVLLLPGDTFATRPADPVLQQLEVPWAGDVSVNDTLRPVSRYFDRITRPEALVPAALQAMRVLTDPVATGAVTLALPQDVQAQAWDWPEEFFAERVWSVRRPRPGRAELAAAAEAVRSSARPCSSRAAASATAAPKPPWPPSRKPPASRSPPPRRARAPSPRPPRRGRRDRAHRHRHRRRAGPGGRSGDRGRDPADRLHHRFGDPLPASRRAFRRAQPRPVRRAQARRPPLVGDARESLDELREALAGHRVAPEHAARYTRAKADWEARVDRAYAAPDASAVPTQAQVLGVLDTLLTGDDVIVNAAGSLPGDLHKLWRARSPHQYHVEYGYSCMGYEIPAALGVALAAPGDRVWALVGDGTYLMNPTEIVTAVQERVPLRLVILDNHGYASIGGLSAAVGGEGFATAYRFREPDGGYGGAPLPVDLAANAASLGMAVFRARTIGDLREALTAARDADRPTCVYVETRTPDTVSGPPPAAAWWDVPVAETATRASAAQAREAYDRQAAQRRRHL